jgi:hypothetical protein
MIGMILAPAGWALDYMNGWGKRKGRKGGNVNAKNNTNKEIIGQQ